MEIKSGEVFFHIKSRGIWDKMVSLKAEVINGVLKVMVITQVVRWLQINI